MSRLSTRQREVLLWLWAYPSAKIHTVFFDGIRTSHHGPPLWTEWWSNADVRGPFDPTVMRVDLEGSPPKTEQATFGVLRQRGLIYVWRELSRTRARMSNGSKLSVRYWTIGVDGMLAIGIDLDRIAEELDKDYPFSIWSDLAKGEHR